jgi:hypothetical protein
MLRRTASATHSLGLTVAAAALVAAVSPTLVAQSPAAQTPAPSRPAEPSAVEPPDTTRDNLSLFNSRFTIGATPTPLIQSWLSGVEMKCIGCGVFDTTAARPESTNATAPWVLQGRWRRPTPFGVVSTGFVGVRNYGLPLFNAIPLGGDVDPAALRSSRTSAFAPSSQWSLTAGVEKTLMKRANGASVGVVADVLFPVRTESVSVGDPRISALTSPTIRFGIVVRW